VENSGQKEWCNVYLQWFFSWLFYAHKNVNTKHSWGSMEEKMNKIKNYFKFSVHTPNVVVSTITPA
jgi:hypothetical protein